MDLWEDLTVVIPFRLASARFPDKPLCRFCGRTLLEIALQNGARLAPRALVLTGPAEDIVRAERSGCLPDVGHIAVPSSASCASATERVVEIYERLPGRFFLTLPVDEPAIDPLELRRAAPATSAFGPAGALTFYCDFYCPEDYRSHLSAKVVTDGEGLLLYMSRAVIPPRKDGSIDPGALKKNVGAFLFSRGFLDQLADRRQARTHLDRHEGLEQLRWLELGLRVRCVKVRHIGFGIDVPEQVALLEQRLS